MIANEFGEAANTPIHSSALFAAGLVLFVLTLVVNIIARWFVGARDIARPPGRARRRTSTPPDRAASYRSRGPNEHGRIPEISARRRRTDKVMRWLAAGRHRDRAGPAGAWSSTTCCYKGLSAWTSSGFFTTDPNGNFFGNPGGIRSAIVGTLEIVALASLIAIPIGIGVALYLTEYGRDSRFANVVRYFVDVMTGVPSIVFGLFIYIVLVSRTWAAAASPPGRARSRSSLLMLPIVIRSAEVVLLLVPDSLREAALALGAPRWRVVTRVVLPTAVPGLVTGSLLAVARAMGETAPLLFTVSVAFALSGNLNSQMNTLPVADLTATSPARAARSSRARGARR